MLMLKKKDISTSILKHGNFTSKGLSYRPISFLAPVAKSLEIFFLVYLIISSILNPGNVRSKELSYRPISFLPPVAKTLEILSIVHQTYHLSTVRHQQRFYKMLSTTELTVITTQIASDFIQQRAVLMSLDYMKAFDTVNHTMLFLDILQSTAIKKL